MGLIPTYLHVGSISELKNVHRRNEGKVARKYLLDYLS